ncbi:MAG: valine--tRNA ligase [Ruminococcaceae bacterium]|nr:valine--tRNA ligase [Oscillospiraceae bacterium]
MQNELPKNYAPAEFEDRLYRFWEEKGYFRPSEDKNAPTYTIVIPPPNITGQLHMGHALDNTLQDILIRYKRMAGFRTLWLPGTDHASIATEAKIVEAMRKEGLTKEDLGREKFLERAWEWKKQYGNRIVSQLKKLGSSCDWSRERFTLDEGCSRAVRKVFKQLYDKGLIYRGERIINWCPHCKTSISNAEVEYEEQNGHFWHIRYPLVGGNGYVEVATTRPETLLGDTAVAVNPNDERYKDMIGKYVVLPLVGRRIPIVADEHAQLDKGTGCVKITPAHDPNDFEVGRRCHLPMEVVLTDDAKITDNYPKYAGMDRYEARKAIVNDLREGGYLAEIENLKHEVGTCYRCGTTIEPMISLQWFVRMEPLAKPAVKVVKDGKIRFVPERFDKNYFHWMENTQDWCISRQLWWGHRIPAYYCDACGHTVVDPDGCEACPKCGGHMTQDGDTLDTWFSSALWPFSTLGWPEETEDLKAFYPTSTLVTGYDIITFWVSRMIFSALEYTGEAPFDTVLIHGLVRDAQGRKMSKSLGNGIDPLEIIDRYGTDALRYALATGNSPGNDMRFSDEKIEAARNFNNKIWNASRFVRMNLDIETVSLPAADKLATEDKWLLSRYNRLIGEVRANLDSFELGIALAKLYDFIWDIFCDWYIELVKPRLNAKGTEDNLTCQNVIAWVLSGTMKLLHPFLPFITEEIWQALPHEGESIMIASYPEADPALSFPEDEVSMERIITVIRAIRNRRAEMNVPPSRKAKLYLVSGDHDTFNDRVSVFFTRLASASEVAYVDTYSDESAVQLVTDCATAYIPLADMIDTEKELARLNKEKETILSEIDRLNKKLSNEGFVAKAPAAVVEGERNKLAKYRETLAGVENAIAQLPKAN